MEIRIERATREDATAIAWAVMTALHVSEEDPHREVGMWIFTELARREDSQYSYCNTLKAVAPDGSTMGMMVSYDGVELMRRREAFYEEVERLTGRNLRYFAPETDGAEWYIDSLAVKDAFRGKGVASALIGEAVKIAASKGKPTGLLVDKENGNARRLYESLGFRQEGERPFADVMMDHLVRPLD